MSEDKNKNINDELDFEDDDELLDWDDEIEDGNDFTVLPGDVITAQLDEPKPEYPAEDGELTILYEDEHILAVDKPAGMLIHPSRSRNTDTLANYVLGYYRRTNQKCAFHPVTRLDRDTFGITLLTKNSHAHALMQRTPLQKTYHALVRGGPAGDAGVINAPIARKPLPSLLREVRADGKESITEYRVLERLDGITKLALRPVTGRTHQLRVHCAHRLGLCSPILGDMLYGGHTNAPAAGRLCLHALSITFRHPDTDEEMTFTSRQLSY